MNESNSIQTFTKNKLSGYQDVDYSDPTLIHSIQPVKKRQSTIICTIGKTNISHVELQTMMEAGMNVAKFKMYAFTKQDKLNLLNEVYKASRILCEKYFVSDWPIATCVELKTCQTKTGILAANKTKILIETGTELVLTHDMLMFDQCNEKTIFIDSSYLTQNVLPGNMCSIGEDEILLECIATIDSNSVRCKVLHGGNLTSVAALNLKGKPYEDPYLSPKDYEILKFALDFHIDMIIINYCRSPDCVRKVKEFLKDAPVKPIILCGICTQNGLDNIEDLLKEADGVLLPREFLTYEIDHSLQCNMNKIQKWMGGLCQKAGKQLIISGGLFDEALENGSFYDSEVFDVANSLMDGASGFILKNCTNIDFAVQTLKYINEICGGIEPMTTSPSIFWKSIEHQGIPICGAEAAVQSCITLANQSLAKAIIIPTVTGKTARYVLDMRPNCIVYTVSTSKSVSRKLAVFRSVIPLVYTESSENMRWDDVISSRVKFVLEYTVKKGYLVYGDTYVVLQRGSDSSSFCDTVRIWKVTLKKSSRVVCDE